MIKIRVPENVQGPVEVYIDLGPAQPDLGSLTIVYPKGSWTSSLLYLKEVEGVGDSHGFVYWKSTSVYPPPSFPLNLETIEPALRPSHD